MILRRRGVSPVIATVILVAVAITIAVAVAYWMGGVSTSYVKFEKVEITTAVCSYNTTQFAWVVALNLKNAGTATATLKNIYINNYEVDEYGATGPNEGKAASSLSSSGLSLTSGESGSVNIWIRGPDGGGIGGYKSLSTGTTVNIKIHSANGMDYSTMLVLI